MILKQTKGRKECCPLCKSSEGEEKESNQPKSAAGAKAVEHGSFLFPITSGNPLGLLKLKHSPPPSGPEEMSDGFYANNDKTLSFINISIFSTVPYCPFRGFPHNMQTFLWLQSLTWHMHIRKSHHFFRWSHKKQIKTGQISINICWFTCFYYPLNFEDQLRIFKKRSKRNGSFHSQH